MKTNRGYKYWIRLLIVGLAGGILLALVMIEIVFINLMTKPAPSLVGSPAQTSLTGKYQAVSFINENDDVSLSGWYYKSENGAAVILLHGYGSNRLGMISRADILVRHGYGVLLYDLRGHGESGGDLRAFGWDDVGDVEAALKFLLSREEVSPDRIGMLGFSIGGQVAIRAAAEYGEIKAIIADDPGFVTVDDAPAAQSLPDRIVNLMSWINSRCVSLWTGIPIPPGVTDVIGDISPRPILFINTGQAGGRALVRHFYKIAGEPKELWEIPDASHGGQFEARPLEYEKKMITFFDYYLLK